MTSEPWLSGTAAPVPGRRNSTAAPPPPRPAQPLFVFATAAGGSTLDRDAHGGNPFASALVELAAGRDLTFGELLPQLRQRTHRSSHGHQSPEWTDSPQAKHCSLYLRPGQRQERRAALVLVVSDYTGAAMPPLAGAAHDERRVAGMLAANGFCVTQGVGPTRAEMLAALASFGRTSRLCDLAVIYATGHGVEACGETYLLPADYPFSNGCSRTLLRTRAISVSRIGRSAASARLNVMFFAGCRTPAAAAGLA